jgi:hypothetical protein
MKFWNADGARRAAAIAMAAAATACGGLPTQSEAPVGTATIVKVERLAWNRAPEPDLYRVSFDERRMGQIGLRLGHSQFLAADAPLLDVEIGELEEEAGRELRAKGLCPGSVQMAAPMQRDGSRGVSAIFKCRRPVL